MLENTPTIETGFDGSIVVTREYGRRVARNRKALLDCIENTKLGKGGYATEDAFFASLARYERLLAILDSAEVARKTK